MDDSNNTATSEDNEETQLKLFVAEEDLGKNQIVRSAFNLHCVGLQY